MGQVYRATDTKLKRQVAIKTLPPSVAADRDRLARFQREAEVLASLNHPHIAAVHGLEDADGVQALVMELVEGDDLSQRLARGRIPLDEALPIARQLAEALAAAHEQGIIHRDLKPANIKVRTDGTVKVLDFGLAKAMEPADGAPPVSTTPTITAPVKTQVGVILGTAAYMSPEQARGRPVDKRADIWAFGCVLYELLTGKPAFLRDNVSDTLAAVLGAEPDWSTLVARGAVVSPAARSAVPREGAPAPDWRHLHGDLPPERAAGDCTGCTHGGSESASGAKPRWSEPRGCCGDVVGRRRRRRDRLVPDSSARSPRYAAGDPCARAIRVVRGRPGHGDLPG